MRHCSENHSKLKKKIKSIVEELDFKNRGNWNNIQTIHVKITYGKWHSYFIKTVLNLCFLISSTFHWVRILKSFFAHSVFIQILYFGSHLLHCLIFLDSLALTPSNWRKSFQNSLALFSIREQYSMQGQRNMTSMLKDYFSSRTPIHFQTNWIRAI